MYSQRIFLESNGTLQKLKAPTERLLESNGTVQKLNMGLSHVLQSVRGRTGGTFAH